MSNSIEKLVKTHKGVSYFKDREAAESYMRDNGFVFYWLRLRGGAIIREYEIGFAIQMCESGLYYNIEHHGFT